MGENLNSSPGFPNSVNVVTRSLSLNNLKHYFYYITMVKLRYCYSTLGMLEVRNITWFGFLKEFSLGYRFLKSGIHGLGRNRREKCH